MDLATFTMPCEIKILHKEGKFKFVGPGLTASNVNPEKFTARSFKCVILGIVNQRVMWPSDKDKEKFTSPVCKSSDGIIGYPQKNFPYNDHINSATTKIVCDTCPFRSAGIRQPAGKQDPSEYRCTPEWVMLISGDLTEKIFYMRLRGSSLWAAAEYLRKFEKLNVPAFIGYTHLSLNLVMQNDIKFSQLHLSQGERVPNNFYQRLFNMFIQGRDYFLTPPKVSDSIQGPRNKIVPIN